MANYKVIVKNYESMCGWTETVDTKEEAAKAIKNARNKLEKEVVVIDVTNKEFVFFKNTGFETPEVDELGQEEEPFEESVANAVEVIHAAVESECRLPSDSNIYHMLWNLYNTDSCVCAEAVNYTIKGYAEAYNWESIRRLARAMELVKENSL